MFLSNLCEHAIGGAGITSWEVMTKHLYVKQHVVQRVNEAFDS